MATSKKKSEKYAREDQETALRPDGDWIKRVNVDIPVWAVKELDHEADRRGITRQALIKTWLVDRLDILRDKNVS